MELINDMHAQYNALSAQTANAYERHVRDVDARLDALAADVHTISERLTELSERITQEKKRKA